MYLRVSERLPPSRLGRIIKYLLGEDTIKMVLPVNCPGNDHNWNDTRRRRYAKIYYQNMGIKKVAPSEEIPATAVMGHLPKGYFLQKTDAYGRPLSAPIAADKKGIDKIDFLIVFGKMMHYPDSNYLTVLNANQEPCFTIKYGQGNMDFHRNCTPKPERRPRFGQRNLPRIGAGF